MQMKCINCKFLDTKKYIKKLNIEYWKEKSKTKKIDFLNNLKNDALTYGYCDKIYKGIEFDGIEMNDTIIVDKNIFGCIFYKGIKNEK